MTEVSVVSNAIEPGHIEKLVARLVRGETRALARFLTLVESLGHNSRQLERVLFAHKGHARVIGFTGPPGAGKSTLVDRYVAEERARERSVAAILVDPSSPISGGALLGDRVRMGSHSLDSKVFMRSMSARGHLGGLTCSIEMAVQATSIAGWDEIVIETVGTGQSEVAIAETADVTVVVWVPGLGDEVQALKAGMLEIGDIIVVNKADSPDADRTAQQIEAMLSLRSVGEPVPVLRTVATDGTGVVDLADAIDVAFGRRRYDRPPSETCVERAAMDTRFNDARLPDGEVDHTVRSLLQAVRRGEVSVDDATASLFKFFGHNEPEHK